MTEVTPLLEAGNTAFSKGQVIAAKQYWTDAFLYTEYSEEKPGLSDNIRVRNLLGNLYLELGEWEKALGFFKKCLSFLEQGASETWFKAGVLTNCSVTCHYLGNYGEAIRYGELACASLTADTPTRVVGQAYQNLSAAYIATEKWEEAIFCADTSLKAYAKAEQPSGIAQSELNLGIGKAGSGDSTASVHFDNAILIARGVSDFKTIAFAYAELAKSALRKNSIQDALEFGRLALDILWANFSTLDKSEVARVNDVFGRIAILSGDKTGGLGFIQRASTYFAQSNHWREWSELSSYLDNVTEGIPSIVDTSRDFGALTMREKEILDYFDSLLSLLDMLEGMYPGLRAKSELVTRYGLMLAEYLGAPGRDLDVLSHAGRLKDIGLTSVDLELVDTNRQLSQAAVKRAEAHSVLGEQTLSTFPVPPEVLSITRHHHEAFDGSGYPDKLRGNEIPWLARILSVAEVYVTTAVSEESNYSDGSYQGHRLGLNAVKAASGVSLDPYIADAFIRMHE